MAAPVRDGHYCLRSEPVEGPALQCFDKLSNRKLSDRVLVQLPMLGLTRSAQQSTGAVAGLFAHCSCW
jgi:hypothetical protein